MNLDKGMLLMTWEAYEGKEALMNLLKVRLNTKETQRITIKTLKKA